MANPLIDNCPEDPTLAAAYEKGVRQGYKLGAKYGDRFETAQLDELKNHVLRLMRDRETKTND